MARECVHVWPGQGVVEALWRALGQHSRVGSASSPQGELSGRRPSSRLSALVRRRMLLEGPAQASLCCTSFPVKLTGKEVPHMVAGHALETRHGVVSRALEAPHGVVSHALECTTNDTMRRFYEELSHLH